MIYCRECKKDRPYQDFVDVDGRLSTRCDSCRRAAVTGPQSPQARRASGQIRVDEIQRLLAERDREAAAEADTLPPPPPDGVDSGE